MKNYRGFFNTPRPDLPVKEPKVVMITGATSGIGKATALLLVSLGHKVIAIGRREDRLTELKAAVEKENMLGEIFTLQGDVTDGAMMLSLMAEGLAHFGRLDVLIANAGVAHRGPLVEARWADLETVLRTNIDGVLHSVRACVPAMRATGGGHIIMISSVTAAATAPGAAIYSASKSTVSALAQALRVEVQADNIWVTNILLGQTHTELAQKRLGSPGKVASKFPTMSAEKVAAQIVWAMERRKRTIILRPLDYLIIWGGRIAPRLMERILYRIYS